MSDGDLHDNLRELKDGMAEFLAWAGKIQDECERDCPGDPEAAERLCEQRMKEHPDFAARYWPLLMAVTGRAYEKVMDKMVRHN
jgi:hypothetical protein